MSQVKEFKHFSMQGKMQEPGLIGSFPWIRTVAIWGNYPHSFHPEFPLGTQLVGVGWLL